MCHHANRVHKDQRLALQKLWDLDTEMEAARTLADSARNNVALCCNVVVASDSGPSPLQEKSWLVAGVGMRYSWEGRLNTTVIVDRSAVVAGVGEKFFYY